MSGGGRLDQNMYLSMAKKIGADSDALEALHAAGAAQGRPVAHRRAVAFGSSRSGELSDRRVHAADADGNAVVGTDTVRARLSQAGLCRMCSWRVQVRSSEAAADLLLRAARPELKVAALRLRPWLGYRKRRLEENVP